MNDLQKWEAFLTEMGIPFNEDRNKDTYDVDSDTIIPYIGLLVGIKESYSKEKDTKEYQKMFSGFGPNPLLELEFDMDGTFKSFYTVGR